MAEKSQEFYRPAGHILREEFGGGVFLFCFVCFCVCVLFVCFQQSTCLGLQAPQGLGAGNEKKKKLKPVKDEKTNFYC